MTPAMRSPAALLASEMVTALRELSHESRLEALALATAETLLDPNHGGDAASLMEAYTGRLTRAVNEPLEMRDSRNAFRLRLLKVLAGMF